MQRPASMTDDFFKRGEFPTWKEFGSGRSVPPGVKAWDADNVSTALRPIFLVSRLLGVLPQGYEGSNTNYVPSVLMLSVILTLSAYLNYLLIMYDRPALMVVFLLTLLLALLVIVISVLKNLSRPGKLMKLVLTLTRTENSIRNSGTSVTYKKYYFLRTFVFVLFANILATYFFMYAEEFYEVPLVYQGVHIYIEMIILLIQMQFFTLLHIVASQVSALKRSVTTSMEYGPVKSVKRLETLVDLFGFLCDASAKSNEMFSSQLFIYLSSLYLMIVYYVYFFISAAGHLINIPSIPNLVYALAPLVNLIILGVLLYTMISNCSMVKNECQAFNAELYRQIMKNSFLYKQDKLYHATLNPREVSFTAGGYFEIDYPIIISILASTTTYIVILVQNIDFRSISRH